jgi:ribonuclease HI
MNIYAVRVGRVPGIYPNWDACKEQVNGYPGAVFKKFDENDTEAIAAFMGGEYRDAPFIDKDDAAQAAANGVWIAYTDGSYNPETKACGAGLVLFVDGKKETFNLLNEDKEAESMRNVTGEILAASMAIDMAVNHHAAKLIIRHDYTGISEWANQHWQAKNKYTQAYQKKVLVARQFIDIEFEHVPAHTGVKYNEEADKLAKQACGMD